MWDADLSGGVAFVLGAEAVPAERSHEELEAVLLLVLVVAEPVEHTIAGLITAMAGYRE